MQQPSALTTFLTRTPTGTGRRRHLAWLGWAVWLAFLGYPIGDLAGRHFGTAATVGAAVGLLAFAGVYLRLLWLALIVKAPYAAWMIALVVLGSGQALGLGGGWISLLIFVSVVCGAVLPRRWVLPSVSVTTVGVLVAYFRTPGSTWPQALSQSVLTFFLGLTMMGSRNLLTLIAELRRAREDLAWLAVTEERLRIARDLHDLLGHTLSAISLKSQVARRLVHTDPGASAGQLADIEQVAQRALVEVREAVSGYREHSLSGELDSAHSLLAAAGIELTVHVIGPPVPAAAGELLAWVVREATTNVLRHSRASSCEVTVRCGPGDILLEFVDDGDGPIEGDGPGGHGLAGLAERMAELGGTLETGPAPEKGFRVTGRLPATAVLESR
ncbi:MAG: sensor histidine kinase [Actinomycetia bacterium]|nr:sensor histidine kinase [Actinomycetes bacterium]